MWDTKHLARQLPALFRGRSTSLGDVYAALVGREMHHEVRLARTTSCHPRGSHSADDWRRVHGLQPMLELLSLSSLEGNIVRGQN